MFGMACLEADVLGGRMIALIKGMSPKRLCRDYSAAQGM
jgi:hypothetical protein